MKRAGKNWIVKQLGREVSAILVRSSCLKHGLFRGYKEIYLFMLAFMNGIMFLLDWPLNESTEFVREKETCFHISWHERPLRAEGWQYSKIWNRLDSVILFSWTAVEQLLLSFCSFFRVAGVTAIIIRRPWN